jgi:hypothetical protein
MSEDKVEQAINVLVQDCTSKGTIGYYKDEKGRIVVVALCPHCADLFEKFALFTDDQKERAVKSQVQ